MPDRVEALYGLLQYAREEVDERRRAAKRARAAYLSGPNPETREVAVEAAAALLDAEAARATTERAYREEVGADV